MSIFKGAAVAMITPMTETQEVNYEKLGELIEEQIAGGTDAIVICGTTGEASTLSHEEHLDAIKYTVEKVNHRIPVIAGTGSNSTETAIYLSQEAEKYGVDGLLLVSPYYNKATQKGLIAHFTAIADSVKVPVILYNIQGRTGVNIAPETIAYLFNNVENIVAVKEASGNISQVAKIMQLTDGKIDLYSGNESGCADPFPWRKRCNLRSFQRSTAQDPRHGTEISRRRCGRIQRNPAESTAAHRCAVLRSKPDSGKSSAEPDGQRGWTASSAADRDGAAEPGAPGKGYERFWNQTGLS